MIMFKKDIETWFLFFKGHFFSPSSCKDPSWSNIQFILHNAALLSDVGHLFFFRGTEHDIKLSRNRFFLTRNHLKWWPEIGNFLPNCWLHHHFLWHLTLSGACLCCIRKPKGAFLKNTSTSFSSSGCLALEIPRQKKTQRTGNFGAKTSLSITWNVKKWRDLKKNGPMWFSEDLSSESHDITSWPYIFLGSFKVPPQSWSIWHLNQACVPPTWKQVSRFKAAKKETQ